MIRDAEDNNGNFIFSGGYVVICDNCEDLIDYDKDYYNYSEHYCPNCLNERYK